MEFTYIAGQAAGVFSTICCLILPFFSKKKTMLLLSAVANFLVAINFFILIGLGTAVINNFVAIVQISFSLWHDKKRIDVTIAEKILFMAAYIICGLIGYKSVADILPILGTVFFMLGVFQKQEQSIRKFNLANAAVWLVYDVIFGSTVVFTHIIQAGTTLAALYKYRNNN